ncbi:MAG: CDP-alcohol phosphatidyltransferase family protein [Chitinophagales bacterium]
MKKHIPNTITLINLACGALAVIYTLEGQYNWVFILVVISLIADFADGLIARALNVKSDLGKELDSLADAVTFGLLPGIILYVLIQNAFAIPISDAFTNTANYNQPILRIEHLGLLYTIFAIFRLGKFNIDTRQSENFIGMATPAAALFVLGLLMIYKFEGPYFYDLVQNGYFLIGATVALSALMISELPMFSFKINGFQWKGNEMRFIFLILCIPTIILLKWAALPAIIILYAFSSVSEKHLF